MVFGMVRGGGVDEMQDVEKYVDNVEKCWDTNAQALPNVREVYFVDLLQCEVYFTSQFCLCLHRRYPTLSYA